MAKKKTVTALSTKTALLVITGLVAAGALAYAGFSINKKSQETKACMNSCLEYSSTDPEYVGVCQDSCKTGEVVVYSESDLNALNTDTTDNTVTDILPSDEVPTTPAQ